jgi:flagellar biosynthesis/type III secretory pathway protein FliH
MTASPEKTPSPSDSVLVDAEAAIERVQKLCRQAYSQGYAEGVQKGFQMGVEAACGESPRIITPA